MISLHKKKGTLRGVPCADASAVFALEKKLPVIDLYKALTGKKEMFPDTVHTIWVTGADELVILDRLGKKTGSVALAGAATALAGIGEADNATGTRG